MSFRAAAILGAVFVELLAGGWGLTAHAAGADLYCRNPQMLVRPHKVPPELEASISKFLTMYVDYFRQQTFVRCVGPKLMVCVIGANLACGKANARRRLPGATSFCRENPDAEIVPFAATGHDTIYEWRCIGHQAVAGKRFQTVDPQGFIAENWREVK